MSDNITTLRCIKIIDESLRMLPTEHQKLPSVAKGWTGTVVRAEAMRSALQFCTSANRGYF